MKSSAFFLLRLLVAWSLIYLVSLGYLSEAVGHEPPSLFFLLYLAWLAVVTVAAVSHIRRVRLIADSVSASSLSSRQRRQIEIPFEAGEAFDLLAAAIAELPGASEVNATRDSLQVRAKIERPDPYGAEHRYSPTRCLRVVHNQILATVTPNADTASVLLICEPEAGAWSDWLRVDDGCNLENAEAIARALTRRTAERRRGEQAAAAQTATEKELTSAKLSLLHAQVEPHFLYNTLASAQYLTRTDAARADEMLGHLITYLRHSLPRADTSASTLGQEVERARAYLEILKIRMGPRLQMQIDIPTRLLAMPFPAMMLQTLVENAIKHGLEPRTVGGTVWLLAKEQDGKVAVTVADDGQGFGHGTSGTGIGLNNIRERLRLAYGESASLGVVANFPSGVAATISLPAPPASPAPPESP